MKDILVHLNDTETLPERMQMACNIARKFSATLMGMYVKSHLTYEVYGSLIHPDTADEFFSTQKMAAEKAKALFEKLGVANSPSHEIPFEYLEVTGDESQRLIRQACVHDLVVLAKGQQKRKNVMLDNLAANVVIESGRPVLLVPPKPKSNDIGKSILVAWNGTAESTRALHDAMPLLRTADAVNVVTFHAPKEDSNPVLDITEHLKRYNVTFDVSNTTSSESEIMENLIRLTNSFDTDLVVMGAYGHSRFREYVLGGVSKSVISELNIPVFLSH